MTNADTTESTAPAEVTEGIEDADVMSRETTENECPYRRLKTTSKRAKNGGDGGI